MSKISIRNLDLYYSDFKALKDVSLEIEENKITAFIGPSGCGKSTLLKSCLLYTSGAGASVPLLGFGNVLWNGVKEAVDKSGFLGIFQGGFKASAVGISAALIFGYAASFVFEPHMKK